MRAKSSPMCARFNPRALNFNFVVTTFVALGLWFTLARVAAQPTISVQPVSRTNNVGDNARFTVTATGSGTLTYQWQFNNENITDATNATLDQLVTDTDKAGTYRVLVSDDSLLTTTSDDAVLSIPFGNRLKLAQWTFNGTTAQSSGSVAGTYTAYGSSPDAAGSGSPSDPVPSGNASWRFGSWGGATSANKSKGLQFSLSTEGYKDIVVTWERRVNLSGSTTPSKYFRLQYTLDGTTWTDYTVDEAATVNTFSFRSSDLSGITGANNNPLFAVRLAAEWESTATGSGSAGFVAVGANTYSGSVNMLFDMVTVLGSPYTPPDEQPVVLTSPQSQTAVVGDNPTFSVTATGGHLVYYWKFENDVISSGTNSSLTLTNVQLTDGGNYSVIVSNSAGTAPSSTAVLTVLSSLASGDRFWSADGATAGGAGTWDETTLRHWGLDIGGPFDLKWYSENADNAVFVASGATPGAITVASPVVVSKITITNASASAKYSFGGSGTIILTNDAEIYFAGSNGSSDVNSVTMSTQLSGPVVTKKGGGRLSISNTGNTVGRYVVTEGIVGATTGTQFGVAPVDVLTNYFTIDDGAGIGFSGTTTASISATKGIYLRGNGKIGVAGTAGSPTTLTLSSPITGPGGLSFPDFSSFPNQLSGAGGRFILNNANNDWRGITTVTVGELRVGVAGALPTNTSITLNGGSGSNARGRLNVNGFNAAVQNVIVSGAGAMIFDSVGTGSLSATNYDVRQSYTATNALSAVLAGDANLTKTTTGIVGLWGANTYTGDTWLKNGTINLNGVGRFGNGAGTLYLDGSEGSIIIELSETRTEENTLLNPVVLTASEATIQSVSGATESITYLSGGAWTAESFSTLYVFNGSTTPDVTFTLALTNTANFSSSVQLQLFNTGTWLACLSGENADQVFDSPIAGSGGVRRGTLGGPSGRTILTGDNAYTGGTIVESGALLVNNISGSGTGSGDVTVNGGTFGGTGTIAGNVVVNSGGSIAAGASAGILNLQNGLNLSSGGTNVWELAALKDNANGTPGADFDQLVLTGGELQLGGSSKLVLQFTGGTTPNSSVPFWQSSHTWTIVSLNGGQNSANQSFASVANGTYNAGTFSTSVSGGNILLTFTPAAPSEPHVTMNPQSRTNIVGTTATFSVMATGSDPLTYKWYRIDAPTTEIPGATNSTLTLVNVQAGDATDYFARVFNDLGNDTSQLAELTVVPRPSLENISGAGTSDVTLTWPAIPGTSYQVQYNTNLATTNWYVLISTNATSTSISVIDHPPLSGSQRYYRLLIQ